LIGDKVVNNTLIDYDIETDLGSAWKSLTSLPFVFAVWAAPRGLDVSRLAPRLSRARDAGVESAELIAADFGPGLHWPVTLAKRYLTKRLKFTLGPRQMAGMTKFFELTRRHGLIAAHKDVIVA
jgi:chorismate dehydratase